jgi:uncharacterized lipoprotein YbaY
MRALARVLAVFTLLAVAGCGQLDLTPESDPSRVLTGTVDWGDSSAMAPETTVTVRVVDSTRTGMPPVVLGSQTIRDPAEQPVAFRVEYHADDDVLRRGLNVEVRVSWGGKVRYFNVNGHAVTLGNAADAHRITVNPVNP